MKTISEAEENRRIDAYQKSADDIEAALRLQQPVERFRAWRRLRSLPAKRPRGRPTKEFIGTRTAGLDPELRAPAVVLSTLPAREIRKLADMVEHQERLSTLARLQESVRRLSVRRGLPLYLRGRSNQLRSYEPIAAVASPREIVNRDTCALRGI